MKRPIGVSETSGRAARMIDVAKLAEVSPMTVSRALRDPGLVNVETLRRIEAALDATGYVPNRIAGSLSSKRTDVVGVIVPSLSNPMFAETIQGVADILRGQLDLMIADSGYGLKDEEAAIRAFLAQRVCGLVLHNTTHTRRSRSMLGSAGIPCVEIGNLTRRAIDMAVSFSNHDAAAAMTDYLIRRGHRKLGFACLFTKDNDRAAERRDGFLAALARHGIEPNPRAITECAPGLRSGGEALVRILTAAPETEAVFLTGDVLATGALLEANRRGWKVPERIAIAGSDDSELQERVTPPLTTVRFPRYEIGRRAAGMIVDRLQGRSTGPALLDLGFEIVERESV